MVQLRGADILARALAAAGVGRLFSLSGNHVMPVYDAVFDTGLKIAHTRHEGAAVHMADAWARLTGEPGVVLLTGGPGHANGVGALYTALASESPVVLLSGHAPLNEIGAGSFQEMQQAAMAGPVTKASWTAQTSAGLGADIARALRIARSGRPGPVHVSLPFDVLEAKVAGGDAGIPAATEFQPPVQSLGDVAADAILGVIAQSTCPLILTGPQLASDRGQELRERLAEATHAPVLCLESPRGVNDPSLGAFGEILAQADVVVLLGKAADFTLRFARPPAVSAACRFVVVDPEPEMLARTLRTLGGARVLLSAVADTQAAAKTLADRASGAAKKGSSWTNEVDAAIRFRPAAWEKIAAKPGVPVHPVLFGRALQAVIDKAPEAVLVADGGEIGQWAQACLHAKTRVINGVGGSIGSAVPFAIAARMARPDATVIAVSGDGAFGFHVAEFDTAVRENQPFVAVVGNDACWNAEHQIQLRTYGASRAHGCELLPTRYDQVATAFGGHGEFVDEAGALPAALGRAVASGRPACVNVLIERLPAPTFSRGAAKPSGGTH
jgi:acetolactate synthase-1/2/3 large subunit